MKPFRSSFTRRSLLALVAGCALAIPFLLPSLRSEDAAPPADPKAEAVAAMRTWLGEVDAGRYENSWKTASELFKSNVTSDVWQKQLTQVRTPLGACSKREPASTSLQDTLPSPGGPLKGPFVIAQFHSSFASLPSARETVTFAKESDGQWRAAGYFIAPR